MVLTAFTLFFNPKILKAPCEVFVFKVLPKPQNIIFDNNLIFTLSTDPFCY